MPKPNLLIVEDERLLSEDLKETLLDLGYAVTASVGSGQAAVDWAAHHPVDLALMDVKLDGALDGIQTAEILRGRFGIPVVYFTAYADNGLLQRAKTTQPYGYVLKPYREAEIRSAVEIALFKVRVEREFTENYRELERKAEQWSDQLEKMNTTLKTLMDFRETEKTAAVRQVARDITDRVIPHLDTIRMKWPKKELLDLLDILTHTLEQITRPAKMPIDGITPFTPMETRVMDLIRQGRTSKEIATLLGITVRGVTFHRENIRKKTGVYKRKISLNTALKQPLKRGRH